MSANGDALSWIDDHLGDAPPSLVERMRELVRVSDGRTSAHALANAAAAGLRNAIEIGDKREAALDLLAADALLTHACELVASLDPDGLPGFVEEYGPDRIEARIEPPRGAV